MKYGKAAILGASVAVALGSLTFAVAQDHGMHGGHRMGGGHGMGGHGIGGHGAGASLDTLKQDLKLTAEQTPAWDKYVSVVTTQNEARQKMREGMHSGKIAHGAMHDTMTAFNRQAATEREQAKNELYAKLSDEQRKIADRALASHGHAMSAHRGGGHRHN